jgi:hypothetical protein
MVYSVYMTLPIIGETGVQRVSFWDVFKKTGPMTPITYEILEATRCNGVPLWKGQTISEGMLWGGVNFIKREGQDLQVERDGDWIVIKGIY